MIRDRPSTVKSGTEFACKAAMNVSWTSRTLPLAAYISRGCSSAIGFITGRTGEPVWHRAPPCLVEAANERKTNLSRRWASNSQAHRRSRGKGERWPRFITIATHDCRSKEPHRGQFSHWRRSFPRKAASGAPDSRGLSLSLESLMQRRGKGMTRTRLE